jgi:chemotaxis regulatin CheY-phosphate phosphatase CheZ
VSSPASAATTLLSLPVVLDRAHQAVADVLAGLQSTRVALEGARQAAVGRLEHTHAKLREVTSTTEGATSEILDALDRAQSLLDTLDADASVPDPARAAEARGALREEMFGMMNALQFQDITTQQLSHTAGMLTELEQRLMAIVALFDGSRAAVEGESGSPAVMAEAARLYAPNASMEDAEARQLVADEVFVGGKVG